MLPTNLLTASPRTFWHCKRAIGTNHFNRIVRTLQFCYGAGADTKQPDKLTLRHSSADPKRQLTMYWML